MSAQSIGFVYLIPASLDPSATQVISPYVISSVKQCSVFFVENTRSARRYLKSIWMDMVINDYEWFAIEKGNEQELRKLFVNRLTQGKNLGIISEAGCPGVADPGQQLVEAAHEVGATVRPLVGPSSILLALMGSGMNGQCFQFVGYLPVAENQKINAIKELEIQSSKNNCTQIFIETPYRNTTLFQTILKVCRPGTRICVAANLTAPNEYLVTKTVRDWKMKLPDLGRHPVIFCLWAGAFFQDA